MIEELLLKAVLDGTYALYDYLTAHVLLCLIPAFFLSGAFNALIPSSTIFKYMGDGGSKFKKGIAYIFAAMSGLVIEVCSCTVLPLFAGIWKKGAGFGPAITFLFAAPGITLLSTPLTASILGPEFALMKLFLSIAIAILIGVAMEATFKDTKSLEAGSGFAKADARPHGKRKPYQPILFFSSLIMIMVVGTAPLDLTLKMGLVGALSLLTAFFAFRYYKREEIKAWMHETLNFMKMIFPLLLLGVFVSGVIKPFIPPEFIAEVTGQNTLLANTVAAIFGTIAYFPTLVEVPVAKMFLDLGMNKGPLMAYLLVDPAISLQTILVVSTIIKPKKAIVYVLYLLAFGIMAGYMYGMVFA